MIEIIRKSILASLGAIDVTREKAQSIVDQLIQRGEISVDQGKKIVEELIARGEKERDDLATKIAGAVEKAVSKIPFATKNDLAALEERVRKLEATCGSQAESEG